VGRHERLSILRAQLKSAGGDVSGRHVRTPWSLPVFAVFVSAALFVVGNVTPFSSTTATAATLYPIAPGESVLDDPQQLTVAGDYSHSASRDGYETSEVYVAPVAPAAGVPDPGTAQAIALARVTGIGWGADQYNCLVALWNKESGWNVYAHNASSGAYGIPQALPGDKMAAVGADWATNPATQIEWGIIYIINTYDTPCGAWEFSGANGYY
jgi:hypothetical protein